MLVPLQLFQQLLVELHVLLRAPDFPLQFFQSRSDQVSHLESPFLELSFVRHVLLQLSPRLIKDVEVSPVAE